MFRRLLPADQCRPQRAALRAARQRQDDLSTRIAALFKDIVYIPYAFEVGGPDHQVFDPSRSTSR